MEGLGISLHHTGGTISIHLRKLSHVPNLLEQKPALNKVQKQGGRYMLHFMRTSQSQYQVDSTPGASSWAGQMLSTGQWIDPSPSIYMLHCAIHLSHSLQGSPNIQDHYLSYPQHNRLTRIRPPHTYWSSLYSIPHFSFSFRVDQTLRL